MKEFSDEDREAFRRYIEEAASYVLPQKEPSEFDKSIAPFEFEKEYGRRYCVTLEDFEKLRYIFTWKDSDIEGNGYEWEEVISRFVEELKATGLKKYVEKIDFETL